MSRHYWTWDSSRKLEENLQMACGVVINYAEEIADGVKNIANALNVQSSSVSNLDRAADALDEIKNGIGVSGIPSAVQQLAAVLQQYAEASGVNASMKELTTQVENLTKITSDAVERSMRNETLDVLREANAQQAATITAQDTEMRALRAAMEEMSEELEELKPDDGDQEEEDEEPVPVEVQGGVPQEPS